MGIRWETAEDFAALIRQYAEHAEAARQLAEADAAEGRFRFIYNEGVHYDFAPEFGEYCRLLKEQLGVEGFVWYKIEAPNFDAARVFEAVYQQHMAAAISARFGTDVFTRLRKQAEEAYRLKRAARGGPG